MSVDRPLTIVISATKALEKWLGTEMPRMPSPDGRRIGTRPLVTNAGTLSWQCSVIENKPGSGLYTAIAVEAHSRFTLLLPFDRRPSPEEFWSELQQAWAANLVMLMADAGFIREDQEREVFDRFFAHALDLRLVRNTDLSVNGHVADAEQWVMQTLERENLDRLDAEHALGLGMHINQMFKRAKDGSGRQERFYPISRFLSDGLYRFAGGLARESFIGAPQGDFPDPYTFFEQPVRQPVPKPDSAPVQTAGDFSAADLEFLTGTLRRYGNPKSIASASELDGFLTAIVSGPDMIMPSEWLPALWGGQEQAPVWESQAEASRFIQIAMGLMNHNAQTLMEQPQDFSAKFLAGSVEGKPVEIVTFWCYGYMRAVAMRPGSWAHLPEDIQQHLGRIAMFGSPEGEAALEQLPEGAVPGLQAKVDPAARAIHAHWLAQRAHLRPSVPAAPARVVPFARATPRVGRNAPCPCGSGKKYKQCCLH